ncbi:MAG: M48 family metalloprotease [Candidatus Micrarchaeota archaeon]|nr:M48 family metalloprotease [Candidatus Micrarchaeota archaeon]
MASFFDEIHRNKLKSILLMLAFGAIFGGIVFLFVYLLGGGPIAFGAGIAIIVLYAFVSYQYGSALVLKMSRAQIADKKQYPQLYNIVEGLAMASQIKMPDVYVINDPNPNAFATGKNKNHASIAVTTGLLSMMSKNELEGVIAHEMSHIYNNDIQFMLFAVVFAGVIGLMSAVLRNLFFFGFGEERGNGGILVLVGIVLGLLAPLFALLLRLAISRRREYMADANGARIIREPEYLASALKKIQQYEKKPNATPVKNANEMTASLYFANPFTVRSIMNLFSTHPPIEDRIKRLESMY